MSSRLKWPAILEQAEAIVYGYSTRVTLRQVFYRLVAAQILPNTTSAYKQLSSRSAEARRDGEFPDLVDETRSIVRYRTEDDPATALADLARVYRRDRTENQDVSIYLGVEKKGIVAQLEDWFGGLGLPILALGGYSSQSYVDEVVEDVEAEDREAILIYAGDFDPSGEDIDRDFLARTNCFDKVVRVALNADQVVEYSLPPQPGKATDTRAASFVARHGQLVQVELDALPPDVLRGLYQAAIDGFWDVHGIARPRTQAARCPQAICGFMERGGMSVPRFALTRAEAAESIGMSLDSFERYVQPDLKLVRRGKIRLVPVTELQRWIDENAERVLS